MSTAKIFWNGSSQAVRLPKEFRFEGQEVSIRRCGQQVILEPIENTWDWLDDLGDLAPTFVEAVEDLRREPTPERDWSVFE